jgi:hypothetical protein
MAHFDGETLLLAADAILVLHALFVAFVVLGLVCIVVGGIRGWRWVRNPWFRYAHLAAIGVVVLQAWLGVLCPLTRWESALRQAAGAEGYRDTFIGHWLGALLYYHAPDWVFVVVYTVFGALVLVTWFAVRPRPASQE